MAKIEIDKRIEGYPNDAPKEKEVLRLKTYEYDFPFNYPNVEVKRVWHGGEKHGMELFPIKQTEIQKQSLMPADSITIHEEEPVVSVVVIGSACTPPGYVTLEAEPIDGERRSDETIRALPIRFRASRRPFTSRAVQQSPAGKRTTTQMTFIIRSGSSALPW